MTQEAVADALGVETATLSRYETGRLPVPLDVLARAAATFSVAPTALFGSEKDLPRPTSARAKQRAARPREERMLLDAWSKLRPRDRATVLALCEQLARRHTKRTTSR